jgi:uncharacterized glyoxalase superfamily protein PhnB
MHDHPHPHEHPHTAAGSVRFANAKPILCVASVPASLDYYCNVLGFTQGFAWADATQFEGGAPPTFAEVSRGGCALMLAQQTQGAPGMWVHVDVETAAELDALYHEYQHSGARISEPHGD